MGSEPGAEGVPIGAPGLVAASGHRWPPDWLLAGLGVAYIGALAALVFLPGGTLLDRLRVLDGGICAQLPSHSFFPGGQQLPLCARNTGIYLGFASTLLVLVVAGRTRVMRLPAVGVAVVLMLAVAMLGVDGFNSFFRDLQLPHLYQPHNLLRLGTGLATGTAMASFLLPVANSLIWRREDDRPAFASFGQLAVMVPVLLIAFLAVASQASWLLYPLALLSTAGLVAALTLINMVFVLGISGRTGRIEGARALLPALTVALILAVVELLALSLLKTSILQRMGGLPIS
ncbi:MAG TPA: DUF2085 domain-containing protein [Ktedonobacterales bacterium]